MTQEHRPAILSQSTEQQRFNGWHFWMTSAAISIAVYYLCLRYLLPGYFNPAAPFHPDFYDYVGKRAETFLNILAHYPRPITFAAMKLLGSYGMRPLVFYLTVLAFANIFLTIELSRRLLYIKARPALASFCVYIFLLVAHPSFYFEYRHDIPADVSYFFLLLSLLCWMLAASSSNKRWRLALLGAALLLEVPFVLSKETYFVTALCIVSGLILIEPKNRRLHIIYFFSLIALESASFAWSSHVSGPFVNSQANLNDPYHINTAPLSVLRTFTYYLSYLFTPALVALVAAAVWLARRDRRILNGQLVLTLAALCAFLPHSLLPNHEFMEYSWVAAPLLLVPVLWAPWPSPWVPGASRYRAWVSSIGAVACVLIVVFGPYGYERRYRADIVRWMVDRDRIAAEVEKSLALLHQIPAPSRVLVAGLDEPGMPWQIESYIATEFGRGIHWTVAVPPSFQFRFSNGLVQFADAPDIQLDRFDWIANYAPGGNLISLSPTAKLDRSLPLPRILLPNLRWISSSRVPSIQCAEVLAHWGFFKEADGCLREAARNGVSESDEGFQRLSVAIAKGLVQPPNPKESFELTANPSRVINKGKSDLTAIELKWQVPNGVPFEIHVDAPDGPIFSSGQNSGVSRTGKWVKPGTTFYLQDVRNGNPHTRQYSAAVLTIQ